MFNRKVENILDNTNKKEIIDRVGDMLDINEVLIDECGICKNFKIRAMGQHNKGIIDINSNSIANNLNNQLIKLAVVNKVDKFLELFIEAILVHELHHLYLYRYKNKIYMKYKDEDEDILYCNKRIEIEADFLW